MKKLKTLVLMLLCAVLPLTFTSCGDDDDDKDNPSGNKSIVGCWESTTNNSRKYEMLNFTANGRVGYYYEHSVSDRKQYVIEANGTYVIAGNQLTIVYDEVSVDGTASPYNGFIDGTPKTEIYTNLSISGEELSMTNSSGGRLSFVYTVNQPDIDEPDIDEPDIDENSTEAKIIGDWTGTDGYDVIKATFMKGGSYSDAIYKDGKKTNKMSCTYTIDENTIHFNNSCNMVNVWGNDYTITFISSSKMVWTNSLLDSWGETWTFEKD